MRFGVVSGGDTNSTCVDDEGVLNTSADVSPVVGVLGEPGADATTRVIAARASTTGELEPQHNTCHQLISG